MQQQTKGDYKMDNKMTALNEMELENVEGGVFVVSALVGTVIYGVVIGAYAAGVWALVKCGIFK